MSPKKQGAALRVAHVLQSFAIGGGERVALDIATEQVRAGHTVWAVSLTDGPGALENEFNEGGVHTATVPKSRGIDPVLVGRLFFWFLSHRIQVVHAHNPLARIYASPAARLARAPIVTTMHGEAPDLSRRMWLRRAASQLSNAFVIVSPGLEDAARNAESAPSARIKLIENGVDSERFHPDAVDRARVRAELGVRDGEWVIGTAARLAPEKDQAMLLCAAAPLLRDGSRLVFAGDGPERPRLEALAAELGVSDRVTFLGMVSDVARLMRGFDVFALSSKREALPVSILEAMATGIPVVATSVGGVPSAVDQGETGLLVTAGDEEGMHAALDLLHLDQKLARSMGKRGRVVVRQRFSLQRMQHEYADLYQHVLAA